MERRAEISALRERSRVLGQEEGKGVGQKTKKDTEEFGDGRRRQKGRKECHRRERKRGTTGRERGGRISFSHLCLQRKMFVVREEKRGRESEEGEKERYREVRNRERKNL